MLAQSIGLGYPTVPGANETVVLFDSSLTFKGLELATLGITRLRFDFAGLDQPSAASGLKGYKSIDKGVTWHQSEFVCKGASIIIPVQVTADTGSASCYYDIAISSARYVKFTFTAGAAPPTAGAWHPVITLQTDHPEGAT